MCAIFGSKDKDKFLELAELTQYRGNFAHSTTVFQQERLNTIATERSSFV